MADTEIVKADSSFRRGAVFVRKGDLFEADSEVVRGAEHKFSPAAGAVRTTSTVAQPVTEPPAFLDPDVDSLARPKANGSAAQWAAYVLSLGYEDGGELEDMKRDELIALADQLEES